MVREVEKSYRFALYGRSGSGKSCLFGTLVIGGSNSRGLTCERLPVVVPKPSEPPESLSRPEDLEAASLHAGKEWLDTVVSCLEKGQLPPPNPPTFSKTPPSFEFRMGSPHRGPTLIRLMDYSGELINPEIESDPESFVRKLKECLLESDGFLVIADASTADEKQRLSNELRRLREAFASLQEEKSDAIKTPVAVIVTKWDRCSEIDFEAPEHELSKLQDFLDHHSAFRVLIDSISNALTVQTQRLAEQAALQEAPPPSAIESSDNLQIPVEEVLANNPTAELSPTVSDPNLHSESLEDSTSWALRQGNCWVFPVSSFGKARRVDHQDLPDGELEPFGTIEPFLFLADRCDELDVTDLENQLAPLRKRLWLPCSFRRISKVFLPQVRRLSSRIPSHRVPGQRLHSLRSMLWRYWCISVVLFLFLGGGVLDTGWGLWRKHQYAYHSHQIDAPETTEKDLRAARDFFLAYVQQWNGCLNKLLGPSSQETEQLVRQIEDKLEKQLWDKVDVHLKHGDIEAAAEAAKEYLKEYPNGQYATEARAIVAQSDRKKKERENQEWMTSVKENFSRAYSDKETLEALLAIVEKGPPHPDIADQAMSEREKLRGTISSRLKELTWHDYVAHVDRLRSEENYQEVVEKLLTPPEETQQWRELIQESLNTMQNQVRAKIKKYLMSFEFERARESLKKCLAAYKALENGVRSKHPELASQVVSVIRDLEKENASIDKQEDQHLYEMVRQEKTIAACERYLNENRSGTKARTSEVMQYLEYLKALANPIPSVEVELQIYWDDKYGADPWGKGKNYIILKYNDLDVFGEKGKGPIEETPGQVSGRIGTFEINNLRPQDKVKIDVKIWEDDSWLTGYNDDGGSGSRECSLSDLFQGVRIPLRPKGGGFENEARLRISSGWPHEPNLPSYR